jgi:hypothetical protein
MRTTINIDDDVLAAAKSLARAKSLPLGRVLSDLVRRGLTSPTRVPPRPESGFPVFDVPEGSRAITLEDVKKLEDEW